MDATTVVTGFLPAVVILSGALTALASALLLWRYRRATLRAMARDSGASAPPPERGHRAGTASPTPPIRILADAASGRPHSAASGSAARTLRRRGAIYAAGGALYAALMALPWMVFTDGFSVERFAWLWSCYLWPLVPMLALVTDTRSGPRAALAAAYFALVVLVAVWVLGRSSGLTAAELVYFWLFALERVLQSLWLRVDPNSPNLPPAAPTIRLVDLGSQSQVKPGVLIDLVLAGDSRTGTGLSDRMR